MLIQNLLSLLPCLVFLKMLLSEDLCLSRLSARWVPSLLTGGHQQQLLEFARNFIKRHFQGRAFHLNIVTCDESWVNYETPGMKIQGKQCLPKGSKLPMKAKTKTAASGKKTMLIRFFESDDLVYQHFGPQGQTINSYYTARL